MNRLCPELLSMILSQIGFGERTRLRLVNKFWMNVIDRIKVNRLVLLDEDRRVFNRNWFYTNVSNRLDDPDLVNSRKIPEKLVKSNLCHLKQLFIDLSPTSLSFALKDYLNEFKHLEELNIFGDKWTTESVTFDLPKLKILSIRCSFSFGVTIKLQTPFLIALKCCFLFDFEVAYPERLTYLEANCVYLDDIQQLVNLERLYCYKIMKYEPVLDKLPKLKEIHTEDQHIEILLRLDEHRASSGRDDLRLFNKGIELSDYRTSEINLDQHGSAFYGQYYTKLTWTSNRPIADLILRYGERPDPWLENNGGYPVDLFDKFKILNLSVNSSKNEELLLQVIGRCRNLNEVVFFTCERFSEKFKSRLAELQPTITRLELSDKFSLDCILKFKYLMWLDLSEKLNSIETNSFVKCLFEQLRYFERFHFKFGNSSCTIRRVVRTDTQRFRVELAYSSEEIFQSLEEVLDFLKQKCQLEAPTKSGLSKASKNYSNKCALQ